MYIPVYMEPYVIYNGFRSCGQSELWVVGVMGRRSYGPSE